MLSDHKVDIKCPKCGRSTQVKLGELKPGNSKRCSCGTTFDFKGDDASRTIRELDNALKKLGKK